MRSKAKESYIISIISLTNSDYIVAKMIVEELYHMASEYPVKVHTVFSTYINKLIIKGTKNNYEFLHSLVGLTENELIHDIRFDTLLYR